MSSSDICHWQQWICRRTTFLDIHPLTVKYQKKKKVLETLSNPILRTSEYLFRKWFWSSNNPDFVYVVLKYPKFAFNIWPSSSLSCYDPCLSSTTSDFFFWTPWGLCEVLKQEHCCEGRKKLLVFLEACRSFLNCSYFNEELKW